MLTALSPLDICEAALNVATAGGASYADVRTVDQEDEVLSVVTGELAQATLNEDRGVGIRVIVDDAWGFSSTDSLDRESIIAATERALAIARAGSTVKVEGVRLDELAPIQDIWCTPVLIDPFSVSVEDKLALLFQIDERLRGDDRVVRTTAMSNIRRERQLFMTSHGSRIRQELIRTGSGFTVTAVQNGEAQVRSWPMAFGGDFKGGGWETVVAKSMPDHAERIRDEAIELTTAPVCPSGEFDLIIGPTQLSLQIHESVGHPNELDRVLGHEADLAGTSFNKLKHLEGYQYGSEIVNLVADNTLPMGLATAGYDDDGVPAQRWHVVQNGRFVDYFSTRETSRHVGHPSRGCNRAEGWSHMPITRIPNLSLMPGEWDFDDMVADTGTGLYMETVKSWSIDQQRLNFQFGCEAAREIKDGKLGRLLRNPNYQGMTPTFWRSCDAIANHASWQLVGVANCGKGQPGQIAEMSHGCSPARFRGVTCGVTT